MDSLDRDTRASCPADMPSRIRSEQKRAVATRAQLIAIATKLFGERGYYATSTNDIVEQARVTRGALYHHFDGKDALFEAVYCQVARNLSDSAQAATLELAGQLWGRILASVENYLQLLARKPDWQQILLIDGPAVFGWKRWRQMQREILLPQWEITLEKLKNSDLIADYPVTPTAHLLAAMLDDAALSLANTDGSDEMMKDLMMGIRGLLQGLQTSALPRAGQ